VDTYVASNIASKVGIGEGSSRGNVKSAKTREGLMAGPSEEGGNAQDRVGGLLEPCPQGEFCPEVAWNFSDEHEETFYDESDDAVKEERHTIRHAKQHGKGHDFRLASRSSRS
jgi:hypothetical protein